MGSHKGHEGDEGHEESAIKAHSALSELALTDGRRLVTKPGHGGRWNLTQGSLI